MWEEALISSEQFVHPPDADARREADFLIQFHVYVRELGVRRGFRCPFGSSDCDDQRRSDDDGWAKLWPVWAALVSNNFHKPSIGEE